MSGDDLICAPCAPLFHVQQICCQKCIIELQAFTRLYKTVQGNHIGYIKMVRKHGKAET
jgi:hydrogenase maturation factor HypF (carbamoyltransferase family)